MLVMALGAVLTLTTVSGLLDAAFRISLIANPLARFAAQIAELFLGIGSLLGTVFLCTHIAVRIFRRVAPPLP